PRSGVEVQGPLSAPSGVGLCLGGYRRCQEWPGRYAESSYRAAALANFPGPLVESYGFSFNDRVDLHANGVQCALLLFNQAAPLLPRASMVLHLGGIEIKQFIGQPARLRCLLSVLVGCDVLVQRIFFLGT